MGKHHYGNCGPLPLSNIVHAPICRWRYTSVLQMYLKMYYHRITNTVKWKKHFSIVSQLSVTSVQWWFEMLLKSSSIIITYPIIYQYFLVFLLVSFLYGASTVFWHVVVISVLSACSSFSAGLDRNKMNILSFQLQRTSWRQKAAVPWFMASEICSHKRNFIHARLYKRADPERENVL